MRCRSRLILLLFLLAPTQKLWAETQEQICADQNILQSTIRTCIVMNPSQRISIAFDLQRVQRRLLKIDQIFNELNPQSDVKLVHQFAGVKKVKVHPEVISLVKKALRVASASQWEYNPIQNDNSQLTGRDVLKAQGSRLSTNTVLAKKELQDSQQNLELGEEGTLFLKKSGLKISLRELALGLASDEVRTLLKPNYKGGFVENGEGSLYWGTDASGESWVAHLKDLENSESLLKVRGNDFAVGFVNRTGEKSKSEADSKQVFVLADSALDASIYKSVLDAISIPNGKALLQENGLHAIYNVRGKTSFSSEIERVKRGNGKDLEVFWSQISNQQGALKQ